MPDQPYTIPDEQTRLLRARLILEEALETISALGFTLASGPLVVRSLKVVTKDYSDYPYSPNLEGIIDGCCDLIYVAVGTLWACGVPDVPHMEEVVRANDAKFPNGQGVAHPTVKGKFGKPEGWTPPDHRRWFPKKEVK